MPKGNVLIGKDFLDGSYQMDFLMYLGADFFDNRKGSHGSLTNFFQKSGFHLCQSQGKYISRFLIGIIFMYLGGGIVDKRTMSWNDSPAWNIDPGTISQDLSDREYARGSGARSAPETSDTHFV